MNNGLKDRIARAMKERLPFQLNHKQAREILEAAIDSMSDVLVEEGELYLPQLGKLVVYEKAEMNVFSAILNEERVVPAHKRIRYRISSYLKSRLNGA